MWPGYGTAIGPFDIGPLLIVDVMHKVLNMRTVYQVMKDLLENGNQDAFRERCFREIVGQIVITRWVF